MATPTTLRNQWQATSGTTPITGTTAVQLVAGQTQTDINGGTRQLRNYLTDLHIFNNSTQASAVSILDGSTVIWSGYVNTISSGGYGYNLIVNLTTPIHSSPGNALSIQVSTSGTSIYYSASGFFATAN